MSYLLDSPYTTYAMNVLRIYPSSINTKAIDLVADTLRDGGLAVYPTDTAYAVGCSALNKQATEKLCRLKRIDPARHTLSIICADISQASRFAHIDNEAFAILRAYTPGPYTFILKASPTLPKVFKGRKQVGLRIPSNPIPTAIAAALDCPILTTTLAIPDVERGETVYPHNVEPLAEQLDADIMIDGGQTQAEISTVVDITDPDNPVVIRRGIAPFPS